MMNWSEYEEENPARSTVAPYWALARAVIFGIALAMLPIYGNAAPVYRAEGQGSVITLTDEPCALPAVKNLPNRAYWEEGGKRFEGCWGGHPAGVVVTYWDDRTVALIPLKTLVRVSGV